MSTATDPHGNPFVAVGQSVALGVLASDVQSLCEAWFNDLRVSRTLGVNWHPITTQVKGRFLDELLASSNPTFVVYELHTLRPIGLAGLDNVDTHNDTAEFSIIIGERSVWGKGLGSEAARLTLAYGFEVLGLYNIWLQVSGNNPAAVRAYEKAGFKPIGVRRRSVRIGRELVDDIYMDAVASDFVPSTLHAVLHTPEDPN